MPDSQLHQQIGKLTQAIEGLGTNLNKIGKKVEDIETKVSEMDKKLDDVVKKDTLRVMGFDYTRPEEHRKDMEWLRNQRRRSDSWRPVFWHVFKALLTVAAIGGVTYLWQSTTVELKANVTHNEQNK